jgi:hypothetical protein
VECKECLDANDLFYLVHNNKKVNGDLDFQYNYKLCYFESSSVYNFQITWMWCLVEDRLVVLVLMLMIVVNGDLE